jgi:DNA replication protein DnaC
MSTINDELAIIRRRAEEQHAQGMAAIRAKIKASGRPLPTSEGEYRALQRTESQRLIKAEVEQYKPDYSRMGILESDLSLTWDSIKEGYSDGYKARDVVKAQFERGWGIVFLWGNYGQAKTLLGKIMTVQAYRAGKRTAYANMSGVLDDIRLAFDERENKTTELLRRMEWWKERDILFIDELDKSNSTEWAQERLFQLLDYRYMQAIREQALTVIASNKSDDELDGYLKSRLNDRRVGPVIHLNGLDGRQVMPDGWRF